MTDPVLAVLCAVVAGGIGLLVPRLVASLPEPERSEATPEEEPKPPYAELAARPGLGRQAALASAVIGGLVALLLGADRWLIAWVPLAPIGVALGFIDWHTRLLPSRIVLPATAYVVVVGLVLWAVTGSHDDVLRAGIGLLAARSVYWLLWFLHSAGMGFGDVRLAALLGFLLGHVGWAELAVGVYAGFLVFGVPGLVLALVRWDRSLLKTAYPFGPFMLLGALLGLWAGPAVADYLVAR